MDSKEITVTDDRLLKALNEPVGSIINNKVPNMIKKATDETKLFTGTITRFFPYLDKAKVKLNGSNKTVLCKILHRYCGDMIDFYTPRAYEETYDEDLHEPCVVPFAQQNVCVLKINDADSEEYLILGYYNNEDIVGLNPAKPGNFKIASLMPTNVFWFKFGVDGIEYRLSSEPTMSVGELDEDMKPVEYANSDDVYTKEDSYSKEDLYTRDEVYNKEEVYTKEEVDELIKKAVKKALGDDDDDTAG